MSFLFADLIKEKVVSDEKLLDGTKKLVEKTPDFEVFENEFRYWQKMLAENAGAEVREEITSLRKNLRALGYDLSLADTRLVIEDSRNDDAEAEGYARLVLCFTPKMIYAVSDSENHVSIGTRLESILNDECVDAPREYHYLWYKKSKDEIRIAAAATERADEYEKFRSRADENPLKVMSALKKLP